MPDVEKCEIFHFVANDLAHSKITNKLHRMMDSVRSAVYGV